MKYLDFNKAGKLQQTLRQKRTPIERTRAAAVAAVERLEERRLFAAAYAQDTSANALVVAEAEGYDANLSLGGKNWTSYNAVAGFSGTGAMQATPNTGVTVDTGYVTASPRLDYNVKFLKTGIHYVWVRGFGATTNDDSVHIGLDGVALASADRLNLAAGTYGWTTKTADANAVATINVTTTGVHTINLWMREDGSVADKILLTTSATYTPTGAGPAVSARVTIPTPPAQTPYGGVAWAVPGQIEAEKFDDGGEGVSYHDVDTANLGGAFRTTGVDLEACTDVGGGYNVGHISAGEWLEYTVNVTASGLQDLSLRFASGSSGGTAHLEVDGTPVGASISLAGTGGWATWQTIKQTGLNLAAGSHVLRLMFDSAVAGEIGVLNWLSLASAQPPPPPTQTPFGGVAWAIPGQVEAENFDDGGEGVAYHDVDASNLGGSYRTTGVDLEPCGDTGGGFNVGHISAGEWLEYTVNVATAGLNDLGLRFASGSAGGTAHLEVDGTPLGGTITLSGTGGWSTWQTVTLGGLNLPAGNHVFRLAFDTSAGGEIGVLNWLKLTATQGPPPPVQTPFGGTNWAVPGQIETENFDNGGEGIAYHDTDAVNVSSAYRTTGVDVEPTTDAGAGYSVGHVVAGEWLEYTVNVGSTQTYDFSARVAADVGFGGAFHFEVDGANVTAAMAFGPTGGWQTYTTITRTGIPLTAGTHVIRLAFDSANSGADLGNFNWIRITASSAPVVNSPFAWSAIAPSPIARGEGQSAVAGGKLYAFGGFTSSLFQATARSDAYDPATNTWTRIADMPEALTHAATVVVGQTIWLVGGFVGAHPGPQTAHVWKYDTVANTWTAGPNLPAGRGAGAAAVVGTNLYFFGGLVRDVSGNPTADCNDVWVLPLTGGTTWTSLAAMPNARNHLAGAAINGLIYAIGGQHFEDESAGNLAEVDVYNPATNAWSRVADLPVARGHTNPSTIVRNGRILVIGGTMNGDIAMSDVTEYDPASNIWVALPALPEGRKSPVVGLINNRLIVVGGDNPNPTAGGWAGTLANNWSAGTIMPTAIGEVAGGIINNKLYLVGEGNQTTFVYNLSTATWTTAAGRQFVGDHHAAEVVNGKLYLIGGLDGGSDGKVQIYNPATNAWTLGASMPFAAGSCSTAVINGEIYVAGGIVGTTTTNLTAKYNPTTNTWTTLAAMPQGRNHAASSTDGSKLYIFGGRDGGNVVSNGFDTVQVYDPATNTWTSSASGATLAPLPQARGGTGKAVFYNGEFYVMGGETLNGAGATSSNVYNRVDIYNPITNTWRLGAPMITARHGIFPMLLAGRIYVAGGGTQAANSQSNILEIYNLL